MMDCPSGYHGYKECMCVSEGKGPEVEHYACKSYYYLKWKEFWPWLGPLNVGRGHFVTNK